MTPMSAMPSAMEWWIRTSSALLSVSNDSITWICQSGRSAGSGSDAESPT